ncbi:MAG: HAD family hydrolase [bacterium]
MIKVIIFDADGVLINGDRFSDALARDYGISTAITAPFFNGPFRDCLIGKADLKEILTPYLHEWGWTKGLDAILDYWFEIGYNLDKELMDYVQELRAKGVLCLLSTDNEKYRFEHMLARMGFSKSFDKAYSSSLLGYKKINPVAFQKIFDDLKGIEKKEILFTDDDIQNIKCAQDFGIQAELYTSRDDFRKKMLKYGL